MIYKLISSNSSVILVLSFCKGIWKNDKQKTKNLCNSCLPFFFNLTLSGTEEGLLGPPLLENRDFSGTEPPLDLRPVCEFKFVRCGPVEKNQSALSFSVLLWRPDEVQEHFF